MLIILASVVALSVAIDAKQSPAMDLAGRWVQMKPPPPGEAPMLAAAVIVEVKDARVVVHMEDTKESHVAAVLRGPNREALLMFRKPGPQGGSQTFVIRSVGQARFAAKYLLSTRRRRRATISIFRSCSRKLADLAGDNLNWVNGHEFS
jgi:hypothetical protein